MAGSEVCNLTLLHYHILQIVPCLLDKLCFCDVMTANPPDTVLIG